MVTKGPNYLPISLNGLCNVEWSISTYSMAGYTDQYPVSLAFKPSLSNRLVSIA